MSINDLLDADIIPFIIVIIGLGIIFAFFVLPFMISKEEKEVYGNNSNTSEKQEAIATVIEKRTEVNYLTHNIKIHLAVFQFEDNERLELALPDASAIVVGDKGLLTYSGKHFISFSRDI